MAEKHKPYLHPGFFFFDLFVGKTEERLSLVPDFLVQMVDRRRGDNRQILAIQLFDASWDTLDNILVPNNREIRFEYGWIDGPTAGRRTGTITNYKPDFTYQGVMLQAGIVETGEIKNRSVYNRTWKDGKPRKADGKVAENISKVSDIVKFIADEMGLEADVEETQGLRYFMQDNETNLHFLTTDLRKQARSAETGRSDYNVRVVGNILYFKTPRLPAGGPVVRLRSRSKRHDDVLQCRHPGSLAHVGDWVWSHDRWPQSADEEAAVV